MAKSPTRTADKETGTAQPSLVIALAIVTVLAGGAGAGFALTLLQPSKAEPVVAAPVTAAVDAHELAAKKVQSNRFPADAVEVALEPIITALGPTADRKMRLEASIIMTKEAATSSTLKTELMEDIVVFLNSVSAEEISGARGLQNLREDLDDRARIRGRGTVLGLLISGFVIE